MASIVDRLMNGEGDAEQERPANSTEFSGASNSKLLFIFAGYLDEEFRIPLSRIT